MSCIPCCSVLTMAPQLVQSFPQDLKYLHTYCSVAIYILTLLLDGYKFNEHTWSNIHFSRQVNKHLWAAGEHGHVQEQHLWSPLCQK